MKYEIPIYFDFKCKFCKKTYSTKKRLPEDHECGIDYKSDGKDKLRKNNPIVVKDKIDNRV